MAPTEILARQHWETFNTALWHSRVSRILLTSRLTAKERTAARAAIAAGETSLIIGTQAVIQQDVQYDRLGLVVIDEQHKFGVHQRAHFSGLSDSPHAFVMTATPIPRSLCLTQYGDLDLTLMTDLPPGRQKVVTSRITTPRAEQKAWDFVRDKLRTGRQAYIVCPHVDQADPDAPAGAVQTADRLREQFPDLRIGLVHGQLDREQQHDTMSRFREQEIDLLVATTVIEVGVDVPNATLMIILDAQQFGLAQLHQLRGRIGRGRFQGYCFLVSHSDSDEARERLTVLEETASGFEVAEADFAFRGPGNVLGTAQSGAIPLRLSDLQRDEPILTQTRTAAARMIAAGTIDKPEFAPLKQRVYQHFGTQLQLPRTG